MLSTHSDLYDQAFRYRRVMMGSFDEPEEFMRAHQDLADLVLARRAKEASAKLAAHLSSTLTLVYPDDAETNT
jgi:DNA-binding GntR family transcriptional regulator